MAPRSWSRDGEASTKAGALGGGGCGNGQQSLNRDEHVGRAIRRTMLGYTQLTMIQWAGSKAPCTLCVVLAAGLRRESRNSGEPQRRRFGRLFGQQREPDWRPERGWRRLRGGGRGCGHGCMPGEGLQHASIQCLS